MNKHEAIKKVEQMGEYERFVNESIPKLSVLNILNQLDEPQKPVVPQFVAGWINKCKTFEHLVGLSFALNPVSWEENRLSDECIDWLISTSNQEVFARAWIDGYEEVEEEKRYYVRFKFIEDSYSYLTLIKHLDAWTLYSITLDKKFRTEHTKKQLEDAGFGWVFDCPGIEIEEVE